MVRAILLSTEENVLRLAKLENSRRDWEFVNFKLTDSYKMCDEIETADDGSVDIAVTYGYHTIADKRSIPTVGIKISTADILRSLLKIKECGVKSGKIAALIYTGDLDEAIDKALLSEFGISLFAVDEYERYGEIIKAAIDQEFNVIVGCADIENIISTYGLTYIKITPGRESLLKALDCVDKYAEIIKKTTEFESKNRAVLRACFDGTIVVDSRGSIVYINEMAKYLLGCREKIAEGFYLLNIFNCLEKEVLDSVLKSGEHVFNHIASSRNKHFLVNIEPICIDGETVEAVVLVKRWEEKKKPVSEILQDNEFRAKGRFSDYNYATGSFKTLIKKAKIAAYAEAPILIYGDKGTEMCEFGRRIHNESSRSKMNYIEIECNALDDKEMADMLFGDDRYHDNERKRKAVVELANGGTLFLNHVDKLSRGLQYRVCMLIKGQLRMRKDGHSYMPDVRVLASTECNLRKMVSEGSFRSDLYYALNVVSLEIPPLRERGDDIKYIVDSLVQKYGDKYQKPVRVAESAYDSIYSYDWPGNLQQLEYFCEKLVLVSKSRNINEATVRYELDELKSFSTEENRATKDERHVDEKAREIIEALRRNNGNRTLTAADLGISKATLWRKMQKYGITSDYLL